MLRKVLLLRNRPKPGQGHGQVQMVERTRIKPAQGPGIAYSGRIMGLIGSGTSPGMGHSVFGGAPI